jgi:endoglucanase
LNPSKSALWTDYNYPNKHEIDYYVSRGMKLFRIPFLAKRLVAPEKVGEARFTSDMAILLSLIDYARQKGARVVLDMHEYGTSYDGGLIGRDSGAVETFAAAWALIAERVKDRPNVIFGLMNEPHVQTASEWLRGANAAIAAIRAAGASQLVLVSGSYWDGAHSWCQTDNAEVMLGLVDPAENYAYEVHQYLDHNGSGTDPRVVAGAGGSRLVAFTAWARQNHKRAFLGEFGWADTPQAHNEGRDLVSYTAANKDVWLGFAYWAGGPWWGDYMFTIEPKGGVDREQMRILRQYLR